MDNLIGKIMYQGKLINVKVEIDNYNGSPAIIVHTPQNLLGDFANVVYFKRDFISIRVGDKVRIGPLDKSFDSYTSEIVSDMLKYKGQEGIIKGIATTCDVIVGYYVNFRDNGLDWIWSEDTFEVIGE